MSLGREKLREAVDRFSVMMTHELEANDSKGDWSEMETEAMVESLVYHVAKLAVAVKLKRPEAIREYTADVGNEAMMVADILDVLEMTTPYGSPVLIARDVVFVPPGLGRDEEMASVSDDDSGVSTDLMGISKTFVRDVQAIDPLRTTRPARSTDTADDGIFF